MKLSDLEILVQQMRQYATENGRNDPLVDFWIQSSEHLNNHAKYAKHCEGDYSIPLKIVG